MNTGRRDKKITIEASTSAVDAVSDSIETWATWKTVWAAVEPIGGRELMSADRDVATGTCRVRCDYFAGLTTRHRILYGERTLDINAVIDPAEQHEELEILCSELL